MNSMIARPSLPSHPPIGGAPNGRPAGWSASDLTPDDVADLLARFHAHYTRGGPEACWLWEGPTNDGGYGVFRRSSRLPQPNLLAHRVAWVAATGEALTDNLTVDHLCFTPACVNPAHLEPVTLAENIRRARRAALGGRLQTAEEAAVTSRERWRRTYWADPEKARARRAARKPCPECGGMYASRNLARHRRTHGGAA